jgi:hypothetical protein
MLRARYLVKKHYSFYSEQLLNLTNKNTHSSPSLDDWDPQNMAKEIYGTIEVF